MTRMVQLVSTIALIAILYCPSQIIAGEPLCHSLGIRKTQRHYLDDLC